MNASLQVPSHEHRILIVEDDPGLRQLLEDFLGSHGFRVTSQISGAGTVDRIVDDDPSIVILDLMLPGMDGVEICRRVRPRYRGGIIMLTARQANLDQALGLEAGADDYVLKPADPRVLLARVRSLIRRLYPPAPEHPPPGPLVRGPLRIDPRTRRAYVSATPIPMTVAEFEVLWCLARHMGEVVDRDELSRQVRGIAYDGMDRSIDIHVYRIRRKLAAAGGDSQWIRSIRGVGYLLAELS